jgi:hypothetical protein
MHIWQVHRQSKGKASINQYLRHAVISPISKKICMHDMTEHDRSLLSFPSEYLDHNTASYKHRQNDLNNTHLNATEHLQNRGISTFTRMNISQISLC